MELRTIKDILKYGRGRNEILDHRNNIENENIKEMEEKEKEGKGRKRRLSKREEEKEAEKIEIRRNAEAVRSYTNSNYNCGSPEEVPPLTSRYSMYYNCGSPLRGVPPSKR